ncbi:MAG: DUF4926 domain-containing protein [Lachnospiraceae bacterium]|nr:DUF4926 domain-containing protein [Lachnospiraceae bacterium]
MKEYDVVKLKDNYKSIPVGTRGTIVLEYDGTAYEVEFFDKDGKTIDVVTTPAELLEMID